MHGPIRVLHVEDEPEFAEVVAAFLEKADETFEVESVHTADDGLARLETDTVDCLVSDYDLAADTTGLDLLRAVRDGHPDLPFILFTGKGSEEIASDAITAGVTDYLQKGGTETFDLLANRIANAVGQHEQARRFRTLVDNLPGIVYRVRNEPAWTNEFLTGEVVELCGHTAEDILAGDPTWGDLIHPEDEGPVWEAVQASVSAGEPFELTYRIAHADGDTRWVWERGKAVDVRPDGTEVLEGFITDITSRKRHEQALTFERNRFAAIFDTVPEPAAHVVFEDDEPIIQRVNEAFADMFGVNAGDAAGRSVDDLIVPPMEAESADDLNRAVAEAGRHQAEVVRETPLGARPFLFTARTMEVDTPEGPRLEGVATYVDLTEQTRREAELTRQNERLDQFVSLVSHDLRNPLNVASGHLDLARETVDNEHLDQVATSLERMAGMIDQLLGFAREGETLDEDEFSAVDD